MRLRGDASRLLTGPTMTRLSKISGTPLTGNGTYIP
jgi:hypothetical protein